MTLLPSSKSNRAILCAVLLSLAWLYGLAISSGTFGELGRDPDDVIRFIQIWDWMNGQSWFDTNQYRLGVAAGTDMHWSRLPDIPVAALAWFFDIFMPREQALHMAAAIWAPLLGAVLLVILARGAQHLSTPTTRLPAVLAVLGLGLIFVSRSHRFASGALDHHNLQLILMMGCVVALLTASRVKNGFIAGVAMGAALAIGPEVYPFIALIGMFVALDWACLGDVRRERTFGFGIGFAISLAGLFILTVAPSEWVLNYCDQLSAINVLAGIIGGTGLALSAWTLSSRPLWVRVLPLGVLGLAVICLIAAIAPQCFGNPLDALPETMHTFWLDHILEAMPLVTNEPNPLREISYFIGTAIIMIIVLMWSVLKRGLTSVKCLFLILLFISLLLTIYQVRFSIFAQLFAMVPSSIWIANCYVRGQEKKNQDPKKSNVAYLGAFVLSSPIFLTLPAMLLAPIIVNQERLTESSEKVTCISPDVIETLNEMPDGVILASASLGADILKATQHRVLAANYHRNVAGIQAAYEISSATFEDAKHHVEKYGVSYIMICETDFLNDLYTEKHPEGLVAKMNADIIPSWLVSEGESLAEGKMKLYRVLP